VRAACADLGTGRRPAQPGVGIAGPRSGTVSWFTILGNSNSVLTCGECRCSKLSVVLRRVLPMSGRVEKRQSVHPLGIVDPFDAVQDRMVALAKHGHPLPELAVLMRVQELAPGVLEDALGLVEFVEYSN
jgi:hypothetical protein